MSEETGWTNEDPRMLREQIRVADAAHNRLLKEIDQLKDMVSFYKIEWEHAKDEIVAWVAEVGEIANKENRFKELLINAADNNCSDMEGADWEDFIKAETRMCMAMDLLEKLGIKYDPITGKEEKI